MSLPSKWRLLDRWFDKCVPIPATEHVNAIWPVDMHNHILPGVDDGLTNLTETMICLSQFADWGIRQVICTPHIGLSYYPGTVDKLLDLTMSVQKALKEAQIPIELSVAAEYMLDDGFDQLLEKSHLLYFGSARYVLIETGWVAPPHQLEHWLFAMQLQGYTPVLAHPERYRYFQAEPHLVKRLLDQGCLMQLNLMSLVGRYGGKAQQLAYNLLRNRCVHFVASDLHRTADLQTLQHIFSETILEHLNEQPLLMDKLR